MTHRGLQFAMRLSPDVYAVQVKAETAKMKDLTTEWARLVEEPARAANLTPPKLVVLTSTYRQFFQPLVDFVLELRDGNPTRDIVVVIPDLIVRAGITRCSTITAARSCGRSCGCAAARASSSSARRCT